MKLDFALRFLVCQKHPVSGRLHFLRFMSGQICGPQPLPKLAVLTELGRRTIVTHPAAALRNLAAMLDLPERLFTLLGEFRLSLEVPNQYAPDGDLPIYLAAVAGYELPVVLTGYQWIEMPDSFDLPYLQREILKVAYEFLMG